MSREILTVRKWSPSPQPSLADQLKAHQPPPADVVAAWPANPFPKGVRPGSATEKIMLALNAAHPRWMEHWELMRITGRSRGAVCWGVRYLAENGLVRSIKSARHPQYLRYQAVITVAKAE